MSNDPFARGSGGKITDYKDRLILFTPIRHVDNIQTKFGVTDAIDADMVVLDGPDGYEEVDGVRIFQGVLIRQLRGCIGNTRKPMFLGRLQTVANKKDPTGLRPTWIIGDATDEDAVAAREYLASLKSRDNDPFS
jgi:hypothetical protein